MESQEMAFELSLLGWKGIPIWSGDGEKHSKQREQQGEETGWWSAGVRAEAESCRGRQIMQGPMAVVGVWILFWMKWEATGRLELGSVSARFMLVKAGRVLSLLWNFLTSSCLRCRDSEPLAWEWADRKSPVLAETHIYSHLTVWSWPSHFSPLDFVFLVCKMKWN